MRKLRPHEKRLLKKVNFFASKHDKKNRETTTMQKYYLQDRNDYERYNKICGMVTRMVSLLAKLDPSDAFRQKVSELLVEKLYALGVISTNTGVSACQKISVSAFCRRRLPIVMVRSKMSEGLREATTLIEQGHVRVGPEIVTDPAFLVTRTMEDFVGWAAGSKIRKIVMKYNDQYDDYVD